MARKNKQAAVKEVDTDQAAQAMAKAVQDGDIVNFWLLFGPFSPARSDTTERFDTGKYAYLAPSEEQLADREFADILHQVRDVLTWAHIEKELAAKRPAQLPAHLVLRLADNAVRAGKYTSAAQAYEMLRIRARMQDEFFRQADTLLDAGDIAGGVRGYIIATGLEYNYSAFPEPLPVVPDFQKRALMLHGEYPERPEDSLPLQPPEAFMRTALGYLFASADAAARVLERDNDIQNAFLVELIHQRDPKWEAFAQRYRETAKLMREFAERIQHTVDDHQQGSADLAAEIEEQLGQDPMTIPAHLLGHTLEGGMWWQYLKELAYQHCAAVLFLSRQFVGDKEILVPRFRADSPLPQALGLKESTA